MISQTSGHGDSRLPQERSRRFFGEVSKGEQLGASFIADGRDEVLTATREPARRHKPTADILRMKRWMTPAEVLELVTHDNAQLLALSGPRNPYPRNGAVPLWTSPSRGMTSEALK